MHLAIKATRTQQGRIEHIRAVGCSDDNHALGALETVHLHQQLVQGLLAFVVTATEPGATLPAHRIDFINKDDTRRVFFRLLEHIAHT